MKISIFTLLAVFAASYPLTSAAYMPQQNITLSVFVAENISSYMEGSSFIVQKNFQSPLFVSIISDNKNSLQYIETQQKIQVAAAPGSTITLTESL